MLKRLARYLLRPFKTRKMMLKIREQADLLQKNTLYIDKPKYWADLDRKRQHTVVYLMTIGEKPIKGWVVVSLGNTRFLVKNTPEEYCVVGARF